MKFTLIYSNPDGREFAENYDGSDLKDPSSRQRIQVNSTQEAEQWSKGIVKFFNDTLRSHETPRKFERVEEGHIALEFNTKN